MNARLESWSSHTPFYRRANKKWVIAGVVLLVVASATPFALHKLNPATPAATTMIYTVGYGNLSQSVSASGTLQPASTADLTFSDPSAKVTSINVKVGQMVKQGQVLAQEDDSATKAALFSAQSAVAQAKASLASAQANLSQLQSGAPGSQVASDKQAVLKAQLALQAAQQQYQAALAASKDTAANQQKLLMAQNTLQTDQQAASNTSGVDIAKSQLALDQQILASDEGNQQTLQALFGDVTPAKIQAAYKLYQETGAALYQTQYSSLSQGYQSLQAANQSISRDKLTIQQDQQSLTAAQNAIAKAQQQVAIDQENLKLVEQQVNDTGATQAALEAAQLQIQMDQLALQSAQAQLSQDQQPANASMISSAEATVAAAQATLMSAENKLQVAQEAENQTKLVTPVNGIVSQINGLVGQPASTSSAAVSAGSTTATAFIVVQDTNTNDMQVPIQLTASQIGQVKDGDPVTLTVPSAGSTTFKGTITEVSPMPVSTSNGTMYMATATVTNTGGLKNGMVANVSIQTSNQANVVTIPASAIQQVGNQNGVYVIAAGSAGTAATANSVSGSASNSTASSMGNYAGPFTGGSLSSPSKLPSDVHFQPVQVGSSLGTGDVQVTAGLSAGQEILVQVPSSGGATGAGN